MQHRESEIEIVTREYHKINVIIFSYTSLASKIQLEEGFNWRYHWRFNCWCHAGSSRLVLIFIQ